MPNTFVKQTRGAHGGEGVYDVKLEPSWQIWGSPHGGYVAATALRALADRFPDGGSLRSLEATFLEPTDIGRAHVHTKRVREGSAVTVASATVEQQGEPRVEVRATFGQAREGPSFVADPAPDVRGFDEGLELGPVGDMEPPRFTQHVDYRIVGGDPPLGGEPGSDMRVWMRMAEPTWFDEPLVVFLADAWMAALYAVLDEPEPVPTLDLSLQVHELPDEVGPHDPLLGVFRAEHAREGYAFEDGTLWTEAGRLVARVRQTRRVLP